MKTLTLTHLLCSIICTLKQVGDKFSCILLFGPILFSCWVIMVDSTFLLCCDFSSNRRRIHSRHTENKFKSSSKEDGFLSVPCMVLKHNVFPVVCAMLLKLKLCSNSVTFAIWKVCQQSSLLYAVFKCQKP